MIELATHVVFVRITLISQQLQKKILVSEQVTVSPLQEHLQDYVDSISVEGRDLEVEFCKQHTTTPKYTLYVILTLFFSESVI